MYLEEMRQLNPGPGAWPAAAGDPQILDILFDIVDAEANRDKVFYTTFEQWQGDEADVQLPMLAYAATYVGNSARVNNLSGIWNYQAACIGYALVTGWITQHQAGLQLQEGAQ